MVNLTIRLNSKCLSAPALGTPSASVGTPGIAAGATNSTTPRPACGPHLIFSDLPLASGVGLLPSVHAESTPIPGLGVKVRRQPGNKVHFCVRCNFPIAIYGRLDPCEHVFCLICAKKDINCYLCEDRVLRIQKIELLDGIFVCGAAGCLRSFLSKSDFEWHVKDAHLDLLPSKEVPLSKPVDGFDQHQSFDQRDPSESPSQESLPASPPSNIWRQPNSTHPGPSPGPEKQSKPHVSGPSRDQSEPLSKRKQPELQTGVSAREKDKEKDRDSQKQGQKDRELGQKDRDHSVREREPSQRERDINRERDKDRDRERDFQTQSHRDRDRELWEKQQQQQHIQQHLPKHQGNPHYQLPPPPPLPPPPFQSNTSQTPPNQQVGTPGPYPPQPFPPFHPQQQDNRMAPRYDSSRHTPFLDPRMAVPPDYQENSEGGRHPQQEGERARNMHHQQHEGYGAVLDRQGLMVPHFGEFGAPPMGMMMGHQGMQAMNRFQDGGHGGVPLPPPPKRGNFGPGGESGMVHPQHMFGWGGPSNFGVGPGHPQFMNWQPPQ